MFLIPERFLAITLSAVLVMLSAVEVRSADPHAALPNILFIMADDHCSQAIGAYGGRLAGLNPTPTIDTLARDGMLFSN